MIKSMSSIRDKSVYATLREMAFGKAASDKEFKDSFVIGYWLDAYSAAPEALMNDAITEQDQADSKISKTITFRVSTYNKLTALSKVLGIGDAEIMRRILYYSLSNPTSGAASGSEIPMTNIQSHVALLESQIQACMKTLEELKHELDTIKTTGGKKK